MSNSTQFTRQVASDGPAKGKTFTGRRNAVVTQEGNPGHDLPLVIAIHGGGFTSAYFDVPGYSLLDRAESAGVPLIAIDRPAYGGSDPVASDGSVFAANAAALDHLVSELWADHGAGRAGVFVIGHSIGASITLALAARQPAWPLRGIAISGCLLREPESVVDWFASIRTEEFAVSAEEKAGVMFGPEGTYRPDMPHASNFANVPVLAAELIEASSQWEKQYRVLAPKISVPVHIRQGEFDALWINDETQVTEFAAALTGSPWVDAELFRSAGHAIDFHRGGAALQLQQLAFALTTCTRRTAS
ncbi:alpha/beta hydrolase [Amycolatopsis pithecellobii]|uniref:Alpha/beta fold hydrolase n=1 Tax=Amycolatopsis pithecellobii TaxID=664692 RepID=A0A6N7YW00_9PSEU|nr:alpha/beta hydrolase [Amycolatopsis pithecellobii]MTD52509.1 alpha/beta fold hydrolase [Amycolatopsis pithecellobii]